MEYQNQAVKYESRNLDGVTVASFVLGGIFGYAIGKNGGKPKAAHYGGLENKIH